MKKTTLFCFLFFLFCASFVKAQEGKNGPLTVSTAVIVNEYTSLTVDALAGNTTLTVANSGLNSNSRFTSTLSTGDLVMIIQIQGATIKGHDSTVSNLGTPDDSTWGSVVNYNNCGNYEFKEVNSVPNDSTIILACPITKNYTAKGRVEVVRVPRYTSLTVNNGGSISCDAWDSVIGGIVALEVENNTIINTGGSILASGFGFRGGILHNQPAVLTGLSYEATNIMVGYGALKGEGISGNWTDYALNGGGAGRGAPANGGGGADDENSAGGGGANGGVLANWIDGFGIPDTSTANYVTAWNLEYSWMSKVHRSGGGRGGYTWTGGTPDPLTTGPGNSAWLGDDRRSVGGRGGRPLDYTTGKIFMGGGGGAGQENNGNGGGGGTGGGIVFLLSYGNVSGGGQVISNGANGMNDIAAPAGDGAGGAGGGGTIVISSTGSITGISLHANGGLGGNQIITTSETEGGAGGGGGGYIATSNGGVAFSVLGGVNGTTNSVTMVLFPPDGATSGGIGTVDSAFIPINDICCALSPVYKWDTLICLGQTDTLSVSGGTTYNWSNGATTSAITVSPSGNTTYTVSVYGCDTVKKTIKVTVEPLPLPVIKATNPKCKGAIDTIYASGGCTYVWKNGTTSSSYITGGVQADSTFYVTVKSCFGCAAKDSFKLTIKQPPTFTLDTGFICSGDCVTITASTKDTDISFHWSNGKTTDTVTVCPLATTNYSLTVTNGCPLTKITQVKVYIPSLYACCDTTIMTGQSTTLIAKNSGNYKWTPNTGLNCDTCPSVIANPSVTTTYTITGIDSHGCTDSHVITVIVEASCFNFTVPNVFTPNFEGPNGVNNTFYIKTENITNWSTIIYDRWGKEMFKTTNADVFWNGETESGSKAPDGVYYYIISGTCQNNTYKKDGFLQLIR